MVGDTMRSCRGHEVDVKCGEGLTCRWGDGSCSDRDQEITIFLFLSSTISTTDLDSNHIRRESRVYNGNKH